MREGKVAYQDLLLGPVEQDVAGEVGDFVVRRFDGTVTYQLAVVVDDIAMQMSEVVRGADLASSTPRQLLLYEALASSPPRFAHVPLLLGQGGDKLSKRDGAVSLEALEREGVPARAVLAELLGQIGWLPDRHHFEPAYQASRSPRWRGRRRAGTPPSSWPGCDSHPHSPSTQLRPDEHAWPQFPQLSGSRSVSVQPPDGQQTKLGPASRLQKAPWRPIGHCAAHMAPLRQVWPAGAGVSAAPAVLRIVEEMSAGEVEGEGLDGAAETDRAIVGCRQNGRPLQEMARTAHSGSSSRARRS